MSYRDKIKKAGSKTLTFLLLILRLSSTFLSWLIPRVIGFIIFVFVSFLYLLSLPIPFLGGWLIENESRLNLPDFELRGKVEAFRSDMIEVMGEHHTADPDISRRGLEAEIEAEFWKAKKKHELGEIAVSFYGGITALLLGYFNYWEYLSYVLSAYIVVLILAIILRIVFIDMLAFSGGQYDEYVTQRELELRVGWQRAVLSRSRAQLLVLFLGLLGLVHGPGYDIAKEALKSHYESGMGGSEFIERMVEDHRNRRG